MNRKIGGAFALICMIWITSTLRADERWADYPGKLKAEIIQVLPDGLLVNGTFDAGKTDAAANAVVTTGTFFLSGLPKRDSYAGDKVEVKALPVGSYSYTSAAGAYMTVRAYRFTEG